MHSKQLALNIRKSAIKMTHLSGAAHIGSILSIVDIVAVLYNDIMNINPQNPLHNNRDRFILSKGHAGVAIYAALAELTFFPKEELYDYCKDNTYLSAHISHINVPGVEFSTGSLGHGISVAVGMAMAAKLDNKKHRIFVIIGDGECNEGSIWEAALFANHNQLSNLTVIIDHNKLQSLDLCEKTLTLLDLKDKWRSFGWNVLKVDGHNHDELRMALNETNSIKPTCIIADTIKGKGVSFMEGQVLWHYRSPQGDFYEKALMELGETNI